MLKKLIALCLTAVTALSMSISVATAYSAPNYYYQDITLSTTDNREAVPSTVYVLDLEDWSKTSNSGEDRTCFFIEKKVKLNSEFTIREGSMLIIRNGGELIIGERGKLHVRGFVGVHGGGVLNPLNGDVIVYDAGIVNVNGTLGISHNATMEVNGEARFTDNGKLNNKGKIIISEKGIMSSSGTVTKKAGSDIDGTIQTLPKDKTPVYLMPEIDEDKIHSFNFEFIDAGGVEDDITQRDIIKHFVRNAETVIRINKGARVITEAETSLSYDDYPTYMPNTAFYFYDENGECIYYEHGEQERVLNDTRYFLFYGYIDYKGAREFLAEKD